MPRNNVVISRYGTEKEFISDFIKSVMAESAFSSGGHTLVCKIGGNANITNAVTVTTSTEVDTQLDTVFGNSSNVLVIWFIMDTYATVKIDRVQASSSPTAVYRFRLSFSGVEDTALYEVCFYSGSNIAPITQETRTFKYQILSNANVVFIAVGGISSQFPLISSSNIPSIFVYKNNNSDFICGKTIASVMRDVSGNAVTSVNRLEYINNGTDPTAIEVIENKVCINSANQNKVVTMVNVWDSSYNAALMFPVNIGNNQYVYLNNYTIMSI